MRVAGAAAQEMLRRGGGGAIRRERRRSARPRIRASRTRASGQAAPPSANSPSGGRAASVPSQPGAQASRRLHDPAHGASALRHPVEGGRQRRLRHRLHGAGHAVRRRRDRAGLSAASWCRSTPPPAEAMPGVKRVVQLEEAVAVVADSYWRAHRALAALKPQFDDAGHGDVSTRLDLRGVRQGARRAARDAEGRGQGRHRRLSRAVPRARDDGADGVHGAGRRAIAPRSGPACRIRSTREPRRRRRSASTPNRCSSRTSPLGGGFGRRLPFTLRLRRAGRAHREGDVADAGEDGLEPRDRHPARLLSSGRDVAICRRARRERHAAGRRVALRRRRRRRSRCSCRTPSPTRAPTSRDAAHPIRTGAWRSVLNSQHGFFKESFIDEMAHAAGKDPFTFRRDLMTDQPRFRAALERVAAMAGLGHPLPEGEGRGIAITECFGSIVARGRARRGVAGRARCGCGMSSRRWIAATSSIPIPPRRRSKAASSSACRPRCWARSPSPKGRVVESNFHDYQMIHMADAPRDHAWSSSDPTRRPGGLGEPCVPPIAPAVANAIFAATGVRVRELPIKNHALTRERTYRSRLGALFFRQRVPARVRARRLALSWYISSSAETSSSSNVRPSSGKRAQPALIDNATRTPCRGSNG